MSRSLVVVIVNSNIPEGAHSERAVAEWVFVDSAVRLDALRDRSCPVCLSLDQGNVYADARLDPARLDSFAFSSRKLPEYMHFRLIKCSTCSVLYASPLPPLESLAIAYREADFDSSVESKYAASTYGRIVAKMPLKKGRALDIGAGDGAFLAELLSLGFDEVVGVEPSSAPIAAAAPHLRLMLRQQMFDPGDFAPGSFDLVTCFQTIEHVYEPRTLVEGIKRVLKPGGSVLFVMHDYRSLSARLLGSRSPIFDVEHLQLFSEKPARWLLNEFGFGSVSVAPVANRYPLRYWCRLFPFPATLKGPLLHFLSTSSIGDFELSIRPGNLAVTGRLPS